MNPASRASALAALLFGAVSLGLTPIFVRLTETGPAAAGFWRLLLAVPLLALLTFRTGAPAAGPNRIMGLAGLFFALDLAFWHYGIAMTSVMNATVLCNLTPIAVTIAGWWLFRERPARAFVVGMVMGIGGAILVAMARPSGAAAIGSNPPLGDLLSFMTTVWYAGYFLCVRAARDSRGAAAIMFWSSLVGVVALGVAMLLLGEDVTPETLGGWGACLGLALVHVAGQGAIAWALGRLPAATASVVVLIQPVVAAFLGWLLFAEAVNGMQATGAALALAGVAIAQWAAARNENGRRPVSEPAPEISSPERA